MVPSTSQLIRFGSFELDRARFVLRHRGRTVRLSSSLMELLLLLVSRPGELVTREQIVAALWSTPNAVDVQQGVTTAVARLRAVLGDDPASPRFIETVIGRGYRFISEIEKVAEAPTASAEPEAMAVAVPVGYALGAPDPAVEQRPMNGHRVAARLAPPMVSPAPEPAASLESDRSRSPLVMPILITTAVLVAVAVAVLAADLAYKARVNHQTREPAPASAHKQITTNDAEHPISVAAISPDGTLLAYMEPGGMFIQEIATGRTRLIPGPPQVRATRLLWFPDQNRLLLTGFPSNADQPEIWTLSTIGAGVRLFRRNAGDGAPAPDGRSIAFTVGNGREIRIAAANGGAERSVARSGEGELLSTLFWSPDSRRVSFELRSAPQHPAAEIELSYVWSYHSIEVGSGRETAAVTDIAFDSAGETADGTLYYLRTLPAVDTEHIGMWRVKVDGASGAFLGKPERLTAFEPYEFWTGMSVSREGRQAAIKEQLQQNIYYGQLDASGRVLTAVRRLTTNLATDCPHSWSPDGKAIYFESDRVGSLYHLFRQAIGSSNAEMLTVGERPQFFPEVMADGKTLVYEEWAQGANGKRTRAVYYAHADGSEPKLVWNEDELDEWRCPLSSGAACVLRKTEGQRLFTFYVLDLHAGANRGKGKELAYTAWQPSVMGDWALSPDGKAAAIPNHDVATPMIRLLALDGSQKETVIKVRQKAQLWGLHWASDSRGFFAELRSGEAHYLEYISLAGSVTLLRETKGNSWAIPTRDGRDLTFVDSTEATNVFLWQ